MGDESSELNPGFQRQRTRIRVLVISSAILGPLFLIVLPLFMIATGRFSPFLLITFLTVAIVFFIIYDRYAPYNRVFGITGGVKVKGNFIHLIYVERKRGEPRESLLRLDKLEEIRTFAGSSFIFIIESGGRAYMVPEWLVPNLPALEEVAREHGIDITRF